MVEVFALGSILNLPGIEYSRAKSGISKLELSSIASPNFGPSIVV